MRTEQEGKQKRRKTAKYELTLAEFPIFILSKGGRPAVQVIEYQDQIKGKGGKLVDRHWRVYPDSKYGFGGPSAQATMFELFQIWKDQGFEGRVVNFGTISQIIRRRGLTDAKSAYDAIRRDLYCLVGVRIEADNAFWDNEIGAYVDMTFHLFDDVHLYKERPTGQATLPLAYITASEVLFRSVEANSLLTTTFDSKFFHSLSPLEQRLALYLSKMFRSQDQHRRELMKLAQTLPIHSKARKKVKQTLKRVTASLIKKGFTPLARFYFEPTADRKSELMVFVRTGTMNLPFPPGKPKPPSRPDGQTAQRPAPKNTGPKKKKSTIEYLAQELVDFTGEEKSRGFFMLIASRFPDQTIYRIIAEVKEEFEPFSEAKPFRGSKGKLVTVKAKRFAEEMGVDLGLKGKGG